MKHHLGTLGILSLVLLLSFPAEACKFCYRPDSSGGGGSSSSAAPSGGASEGGGGARILPPAKPVSSLDADYFKKIGVQPEAAPQAPRVRDTEQFESESQYQGN